MRTDHVERARSLFVEAAQQGLSGAMFHLAAIALNHDKNEAESRHWLEQASDLGHIDATYVHDL